MLRGQFLEAILVEDGELVHRGFPVRGRSSPVLGDVAQRQPYQLGGGIVAGEVTAGLDDLSQPRVHALDGVGRVDDATHLGREDEEGVMLVRVPKLAASTDGLP